VVVSADRRQFWEGYATLPTDIDSILRANLVVGLQMAPKVLMVGYEIVATATYLVVHHRVIDPRFGVTSYNAWALGRKARDCLSICVCGRKVTRGGRGQRSPAPPGRYDGSRRPNSLCLELSQVFVTERFTPPALPVAACPTHW